MSETPRRYSAEDIRDLAKMISVGTLFKATVNGLNIGLDPKMLSGILDQAAEDASRLEQIDKWLNVQMSEGELRGYLPDLRKFLSSSAVRREDKT